MALALILGGSPALVSAETGTATSASVAGTATMLELIKSLMKQVEELQKQLTAMRGEIRELRSGLREGMENDDVKKVQELLATDPTIYPKGSVTGYFGPLTKEAIIAFQKKHGLPETGEVDEATKKLLQDYLKKKTDKTVAPGWMKAPGLEKKIEDKKWVEDKVKDPNAYLSYSEGMIKAAKEAISKLEDAIEEAEDDNEDADDVEDAEEDLARAKTELATAEDYYDDKEYQKAHEEAYKAKLSAYAGIDELK